MASASVRHVKAKQAAQIEEEVRLSSDPNIVVPVPGDEAIKQNPRKPTHHKRLGMSIYVPWPLQQLEITNHLRRRRRGNLVRCSGVEMHAYVRLFSRTEWCCNTLWVHQEVVQYEGSWYYSIYRERLQSCVPVVIWWAECLPRAGNRVPALGSGWFRQLEESNRTIIFIILNYPFLT